MLVGARRPHGGRVSLGTSVTQLVGTKARAVHSGLGFRRVRGEDAWPPPDPLPTTIAWRVIHLAAWTDIDRLYASGDTRPDINEFDVPRDCIAGVALLYAAQDDFIEAVDGLSAESALEPRHAQRGRTGARRAPRRDDVDRACPSHRRDRCAP